MGPASRHPRPTRQRSSRAGMPPQPLANPRRNAYTPTMTPPRLAIGTSDFCNIRRAGSLYVDKTAFVVDVLRADASVLLLPRPRRFGKTLNLSTLAAFSNGYDATAGKLVRCLLSGEFRDNVNLFRGVLVGMIQRMTIGTGGRLST